MELLIQGEASYRRIHKTYWQILKLPEIPLELVQVLLQDIGMRLHKETLALQHRAIQ